MLMARCDRKECNTVIEISREVAAPKGWIQVRVETDGKYSNASQLEFCSEKCVSLWAKERKQYQQNRNGIGLRPMGGNARASIQEAMDICYSERGGFTSKDIQSLTGVQQSTADRHIREMLESGDIVILNEPENGHSPRTFSLAPKA